MEQGDQDGHEIVREQYDEIESRFEEGMRRMALYHRHCQDPVIFRTLGEIRGNSLLDLACGNGFYTRRFRRECGADPVMGVDLSPMLIRQAKASERHDPLGIEYRVGDVTTLELDGRFDVVTAIHLLHYLQSAEEIEGALRRIHALLRSDCSFVTMVANPEFDIGKHARQDSKRKFGYYFSEAQPGNGGLMRFHPGGFDKEQELTFELRRWEREFLNDIARKVGFAPEWRDPFISAEGLAEHGADFFANYLANPQSKLLRLTKV
ncbi:MAG TPA: class I SAM-dependent methyltransferase [Acidobacteriota bacterium]|nr:class I SAM-dependent methyltransferase [Acidobacteriota bacterium]